MNFISGTIRDGLFAAPGIDLPLPVQPTRQGEAVYGIRPEHFVLSDDGFAAEVIVTEPMGSETQVTMKLGETSVIGIFRERITTAPGQHLRLSLDPQQVHLFDPETGDRLN